MIPKGGLQAQSSMSICQLSSTWACAVNDVMSQAATSPSQRPSIMVLPSSKPNQFSPFRYSSWPSMPYSLPLAARKREPSLEAVGGGGEGKIEGGGEAALRGGGGEILGGGGLERGGGGGGRGTELGLLQVMPLTLMLCGAALPFTCT